MLVLSRKAKQQILIGENIVITVVQLKGDAVRIGIEAPSQVRVLRSEIVGRPPKDAADQLRVDRASGPVSGRSEAGRSSGDKSFSSPDCEGAKLAGGDAMLIGESSGLYPRLRLRRCPPDATISSLAAARR